ncbi:twin-arginine translocation signal domain-containing protein [Mesorhizobium sp. M1A.F.Ca.IN.020.06.1.1]|uniref:ABC transporter substrate-binding protein n=1 Tax=unclassified Mesorhizobium TaxID=325217 RepID=UPI000FCBAFDD|nr:MULTISPECIES: ABC transporter substrate-binding protein [unclassified Mesorhizobium]RUV81355.1 twin-arginine translocation signal domain-containing protein [Mesorhizobium sp. M1A.F.Ca.IN.020.32.1.1]RUW05520.1 twin-arginine translocation signal domain-containing protein [Mesorhizobium sp. M1A.F.Ca.IN.022.05.2.1]RUW30324.1 twin-arginine translocation signal domain-containing protein [Mesorhizobium sp. M1A.F.Ca.IN.020.06.1.1]RWF85004.1 MAG: twin-arginine translocation signal domain-containing p
MTDEMQRLSQQVVRGRLSRRDFLGRAAALGLSAPFAGSLLLNGARAAAPVKGGVLKAGLQGGAATDTLDTAHFSTSVDITFGRAWGEQLVQIDPKGGLQPALAEEWGSSKDAKVWTFKIRKGVQFHDGKEMTPADVLATMERHSDKNSKSGALGIMQGIDKIAVDGQNVVFTLKDPNADLPFLMDDYHLIIQPNGGKGNPAAGIGTGPYKVTVNEPGVRLGGEKFAGYWRDDRGFADQVEVIVINDATARMSALQSGQVHIVNFVQPKLVDLIKRVPGMTIRNVSGRGHYVFVARCKTAPFDNSDLRMALKFAIDREEMLDKVLRGYGTVGNDFPINAAYPLFTEVEQRKYDPDKAKFHYKKSGHDGTVLLRTSDVAFPGAVDAAQLFQQSAAKAGIKLEIKREPGDGYWSEVWQKQPFCASYWGGRPTQDQMYSVGYYSKADWNESQFANDKFDKMLFQARAELDPEKRKKIYADMGTIVNQEGGTIVPMFNQFIDATGAKVEGWIDDPNYELSGYYALSRCWIAG